MSIVRVPEQTAPLLRATTTRPIRILLCASAPARLRQIDVAGEMSMLSSVLGGFGGGVEVFRLNEHPAVCTFERLEHVLETQGPWHLVHFSGHGHYDQSVGGLLVFTSADGQVDSQPAARVAAAMASHEPLRLVVLNACRGAMGGNRQVIDSVGGALVHRGVPACVSMQFEVTDRAALPFRPVLPRRDHGARRCRSGARRGATGHR